MQEQGLYPSRRTVDEWTARYLRFGHFRAFRRTGNHRACREVRGQDLHRLALFRTILPKATIAEVNAFLFRLKMEDANFDFRFYSPSQICRAKNRLVITTKRGSTTANQALEPINIQRRENFWNLPYPFGTVGIHPNDMIDLDEAGVYPHQTNRKSGKRKG